MALFGFGGGYLITQGAHDTVATGPIFYPYDPAYEWLHFQSTGVKCEIEALAADESTILNVEFKAKDAAGAYLIGSDSIWTNGTRNETNWEHWYSNGYSIGTNANVTCIVRVTQLNYNPTSETQNQSNFTIYPIGYALPTCAGKADCVLSSSQTTAYNVTHRRVTIQTSTLTLSGTDQWLNATEYINITGSGTIDFSGTQKNITLNTLAFRNGGTLNGAGSAGTDAIWTGSSCTAATAGANGGNLTILAGTYNNTGSILLSGGAGGDGCAGVKWSTSCNKFTATGESGGKGGVLSVIGVSPETIFGSVTMTGGGGGDGSATYSCDGGCINLDGYSLCAHAAAAAGIGGSGGNITFYAKNLTASLDVAASGGSGGTGACSAPTGHMACSNGANGGAGGRHNYTIYQSLIVTGFHTSSGGSGGAASPYGGSSGSTGAAGLWNITYCRNGTGMDWTKFTPSTTGTTRDCIQAPTFTFVSPNESVAYTPINDTVSVILSETAAEMRYLVQYSLDNGSTYHAYVTQNRTSGIPVYASNSIEFDTHRQAANATNKSIMRAIGYNVSNGLFSEWVYSDKFNLTGIPTNTSAWSVPDGLVTTDEITFYCNYTNLSTDVPIWNPTARINIDSVYYNMTYDGDLRVWLYDQTTADWSAGDHTWYCDMSRVDYTPGDLSNESSTIELAGFGIVYANGEGIYLTCPFPTIDNIVPAGQTARKGAIRIINYNVTHNKNYTFYLEYELPNVYVCARSDRYTEFSAVGCSGSWQTMSSTTGLKLLQNINASNTTAYVWFKARCLGATPGVTDPYRFIIVETDT